MRFAADAERDGFLDGEGGGFRVRGRRGGGGRVCGGSDRFALRSRRVGGGRLRGGAGVLWRRRAVALVIEDHGIGLGRPGLLVVAGVLGQADVGVSGGMLEDALELLCCALRRVCEESIETGRRLAESRALALLLSACRIFGCLTGVLCGSGARRWLLVVLKEFEKGGLDDLAVVQGLAATTSLGSWRR